MTSSQEPRRGSEETGLPAGFEKMNLNDATRDDLLAIEGIGEATAERLLDYRQDIGPFRSFDELTNIPTVTSEKIELLERHFSIGIS
ncbi:helix-hairpin-helix domain-containing protein [Persicimonas caeni]|uniref:Helix-hairpin-helix domain-containing protein n=1 Tax=Persicimonas caeni TaxID=2292766 RepID=A0A4Y6PY82_PERCE|nr:helix-hairpin-helix domain-containing protein [Persicimonas caeni]QDG53288.1 helix-hairpin-helix domain-containing protein [Persicimonas caeni]QED34510.1 helix-hairpin-helix domain-containing protein [Persicimonas caeni]